MRSSVERASGGRSAREIVASPSLAGALLAGPLLAGALLAGPLLAGTLRAGPLAVGPARTEGAGFDAPALAPPPLGDPVWSARSDPTRNRTAVASRPPRRRRIRS